LVHRFPIWRGLHAGIGPAVASSPDGMKTPPPPRRMGGRIKRCTDLIGANLVCGTSVLFKFGI
jgi:hypothetical protein